MLHHIQLIPLILTCTIVPLFAMKKEDNVPNKLTLDTIPEYYSEITCALQQTSVYINRKNPNLHKHRVYILDRKEDCHIIGILCENAHVLNEQYKKTYPLANTSPLAITSFSQNSQSRDHKGHTYNRITYGIKCPSNNRNCLIRPLCFKIIDTLKEGWIELPADDYYTHPHKASCTDNPHKDTINDWRFFSKRTDTHRPHFLHYEQFLIKCLVTRFDMADKVTCRATRTNDLKRIGAIHIWVLKTAFEEFKQVFDFDCKAPSNNLTWLKILNV